MPRICALCVHPQRAAMDQAVASGTPLREITGQFGTSKSALDRHRDHITMAIAKAESARTQLSVEAILNRLARLETHAEEVLAKAQRTKDQRLVLSAIKELREQVEAIGRLARDVAASRDRSACARCRNMPADLPDAIARLIEELAERRAEEISGKWPR